MLREGHFLLIPPSLLSVMDAIPTVVCDTLYSMGLHDQTPSWKIMDSRGRITVSPQVRHHIRTEV